MGFLTLLSCSGMSPKKRKPQPNTRHYASEQLVLSKNQGLVASESSVSSCPSSSSPSDSDTEPQVRNAPIYRLKITLPAMIENASVFDIGEVIIIPHKSNKEKSLIVVRNFFSTSRIGKLRRLFQTAETVFEIKDRKSDLHYAHVAYRTEITLRLEMHKTYKRIMETTVRVCDSVWGDIRQKTRKNRVIPEMEYIVYDVKETAGSKGTFIEPHVDNHSIVTGISMLSEPDVDFVGGVNRFKGQQTEETDIPYRQVKLDRGDLVLFRGEVVTHWITPVIRGRREILQWELSRI